MTKIQGLASTVLLGAAAVCSATDYTVSDVIEMHGEFYAVGDTVSIPAAAQNQVLAASVAELDAAGTLVTMTEPGFVKLRSIDAGSNATDVMFGVYAAPAGGDVFAFDFGAAQSAAWNSAPWVKVTSNTGRAYPNAADDVAMLISTNRDWATMHIPAPGVTVGQLILGNTRPMTLRHAAGATAGLAFSRTDGETPGLWLSKLALLQTGSFNFCIGERDGDDGANYLDVSFTGESLDFNWLATEGQFNKRGIDVQLGCAKIRIGAGQTLRLRGGSSSDAGTDAFSFSTRAQCEIAGAGAMENRGITANLDNSTSKMNIGAYREMSGSLRPGFGYRKTTFAVTPDSVPLEIWSASSWTNAVWSYSPYSFIRFIWEVTGPNPGNLTRFPSLFASGGCVEIGRPYRDYTDDREAKNEIAELTVRGHTAIYADRSHNTSSNDVRVIPTATVKELLLHDPYTTLEFRGFNLSRGRTEKWRGWAAVENWEDYAIRPEGVDPADYTDFVHPIIPFLTCTANDNGYQYNNYWSAEQSFPDPTGDSLMLRNHSGNSKYIEAAGENEIVYFWGKGIALSADKTIFALVYATSETPPYHANLRFGQGKTLTVSSGAMIAGKYNQWLGHPADMSQNGVLRLAGAPSYIHTGFGLTARVTGTNGEDHNMIWAPIIATNDLVKGGVGDIGIAGDQRGILGTVAINGGRLFLGYPKYLENGYLYNNSEARGWPMHGAATAADTFLVRGGAQLAICSQGYAVAGAVLPSIQRNCTIRLQRSGEFVGSVYLDEGVEMQCYEIYDGDAPLAVGVWGSSESGAEHVNDELFRGAGTIAVRHYSGASPTLIIIR